LNHAGLLKWLQKRVIPRNRAYASEILRTFGLNVNDTRGIMDVCRGLSLNDSFWVVPEGFAGTFAEYNLYENCFSESLALVAYTGIRQDGITFTTSPELTTNGMLPKGWRFIEGDGIYLYKGGTSGAANAGNEPYSEFYASQIAQAMGLHAVRYELENWRGMHYQVAKDHGFTAIADVVILDENGSMALPVTGGTRLTENYVGAHFADYDSYLVLSHFKGHAMSGFGGAIKNISIGIGSSEGKSWIHSGGTSRTNPWGGDQTAFTESMAEAGKSVADALDGKIVYINVMNRLSVDCDCDGNPAEPDLHDIGILASYDPVALDQACVDLIYAQKDGDGASLVSRIESRNGLHTLEHGEEIGLGSRKYQLVGINR